MCFLKTHPAAGLSSHGPTQLQRSSTGVWVPRVRGCAGGSCPSAQGEGDGSETPVSIGLPPGCGSKAQSRRLSRELLAFFAHQDWMYFLLRVIRVHLRSNLMGCLKRGSNHSIEVTVSAFKLVTANFFPEWAALLHPY